MLSESISLSTIYGAMNKESSNPYQDIDPRRSNVSSIITRPSTSARVATADLMRRTGLSHFGARSHSRNEAREDVITDYRSHSALGQRDASLDCDTLRNNSQGLSRHLIIKKQLMKQ